jgi:hypothetical protein
LDYAALDQMVKSRSMARIQWVDDIAVGFERQSDYFLDPKN